MILGLSFIQQNLLLEILRKSDFRKNFRKNFLELGGQFCG